MRAEEEEVVYNAYADSAAAIAAAAAVVLSCDNMLQKQHLKKKKKKNPLPKLLTDFWCKAVAYSVPADAAANNFQGNRRNAYWVHWHP